MLETVLRVLRMGGGRPASARGFVLLFCASIAALACSYFAAAVVVNPRGYFDSDLFPQVVLDSRRDKMKLFERFNAAGPVEGLILGSSRSMKIAPAELEALTGLRFFNLCVDSARSEDYLALYRWAKRCDPDIKALALGLDVEAFHDDDKPDQRLRDNAPLWRELQGPGRGPSAGRVLEHLGRLEKVMSRYYAQEMARSVVARWRPKESTMSFDADGLLRYGVWEREVGEGSFDLGAHIDASKEEYQRRFGGMTGLSAQRRHYFEQLLGEAGRDGVDTVVWITPIHPEVAASLRAATRYEALLRETRAYAEGVCGPRRAATLDFSEPALFGGTEVDWFDGGHISQKNATLIARQIARGLKRNGL